MTRSLADGHTKFTILLAEPADPANPLPSELNALTAIDASCAVTYANFQWDFADSDRIDDRELCASNNAQVLGAENLVADFTVFREWDDTTLQAHATADALFQALKERGTVFWGYRRTTAKEYDEPWAAGDEFIGIKSLTDNPQDPSDAGGFIKKRIPQLPQRGWAGEVAVVP
jgi:hypothetical protein